MSVQSTRQGNEELLEQTALQKTTADFSTGAQIEDAQFESFMRLVEDSATVLSQVRRLTPTEPSGNIPQLGVGSRLLRSVSEGGSTAKNTIQSSDVPYATSKVSLPWEQTWEENNELIDDPEEEKRQLFANQFGRDLEILASVGDTANADAFISIEDGWLTLADGGTAPNHDHMDGGTTAQPVNNELFEAMINLMPERYENSQTLVFLMSSKQKQEYKESLTSRSTSAGDQMLLSAEEPTPYGYNILSPLGWPDDRAMFTSLQNLVYLVQDPMRLKSTASSERNVMNDIERIYNLLAKIDYQIMEQDGCVTASNIAAP